MTSNDELILTNKIKNLSVHVTDEISPKYLKEFIKTSLEIENLSLNIQNKIFLSFIEEIQTYEIYILESTLKLPLNIYQIFSTYYYNNESTSIDLFITKDFFTVYKNGIFYFSKRNKDYSKDDILSYISFNYKIKIDNVYTIDDNSLEGIKENYLANFKKMKKLNYISFEENNSYKYFLIYIFILLILSSYMFYEKLNEDINCISKNNIQQLDNYKKKYQNLLNIKSNTNNITKDIIEFFNYLKIYKIYLIKMEYKDGIHASIVADCKDKLYNFISMYDKKTKVLYIKKDKNIAQFVMEIKIDI